LLTGSRVKIGFEAGLKLLRAGALVIATTRFPHDCAKRYLEQQDSSEWKHRLHVFGLDLRDLSAVVRFCDILRKRYDRLDAIVNNAAQVLLFFFEFIHKKKTIRRPPAYYTHLLDDELRSTDSLPQDMQDVIRDDPHRAQSVPRYMRIIHQQQQDERNSGASPAASSGDKHHDLIVSAVATALNPDGPQAAPGSVSAALSQVSVAPGDEVHDQKLFPLGYRDVTGQQLDLRRENSWLLLLDQIHPSELIEVFAINGVFFWCFLLFLLYLKALSPFILNSRLKALMASPTAPNADLDKYIVNVSAMEGKFYRFKGPQHPHTSFVLFCFFLTSDET
jgi:hypothetical protein